MEKTIKFYREQAEIAVLEEGVTEEGRLRLCLKDVQDLAGPQRE